MNTNFDKDSLCDLFRTSLRQENKYYREKLFQINNDLSLISYEDSELLRIAIQENDVDMTHRMIKHGANLDWLDSIGCAPIEDALRSNNLEMICMLLYYGGYTNNLANNVTSFMFSIISRCTEEVQSTLMEYEADYNICSNNETTLYLAVKYRSPLFFELLKRGADPNFFKISHKGLEIGVLVAIEAGCDVKIVRVSHLRFSHLKVD